MKHPLVSIIIVNWNGKKWLKGCLSSLSEQTYKQIEILLVDNNSTDESVEYTKKNFPQVKIIERNLNDGFAHANNIGYQHAKGAYILFLNNDTVVTKNFLEVLVSYMQSHEMVGGAQSKLLLMDDHSVLDAAGAYLTHTGFLNHYGFHQKDDEKFIATVPIYTLKGACMIFRREVLQEVSIQGNIFDPSYFAYFEETDLCHRIWLHGYTIMYVPAAVVYHKAGGTSAVIDHPTIQFHSFKNRIQSYLTNLPLGWISMMMPIHLGAVQFFAFYALLGGNIPLFMAVQRSIWWNIIHMDESLRKRRIVRGQMKRVSDQTVFASVVKDRNIQYYYHLLQSMSMYQR